MVYTLADGTQMTRRKKIVLTGASSGALSDYQLKLTAAYSEAMQVDYDDARFTKADMQTQIDAWLESKTDSTTADIWVEFPTTPADGVVETEAYMYYGNSGVASDWDGAATFLQYHGAATYNFLDSAIISPPHVFIYEAKITTPSGTHNTRYGLSNNANFAIGDTICIGDETNFLFAPLSWNNGSETYSANTTLSITIHKLKTIITSAPLLSAYVDDVERGTAHSTNIPNEAIGLGLQNVSGAPSQDWSFVRKYAANPPTAEFGTEEHQRRTPMMM